jgi:hypothetical protein
MGSNNSTENNNINELYYELIKQVDIIFNDKSILNNIYDELKKKMDY